MRRYTFVLFAVLMAWMVGDHAILAQRPIDNCPPRYRRDPAAANRAREAKKAYLRSQGMPERFLHLLDREECVACIEMASDAFHIMVVYDEAHAPTSSKGDHWTQITFKWDPQSERQVRDQLAAGTIKAFYIMNTATRCQCCPDVSDDSKTDASYADWNPELGVHMSHVIAFDDKSDLGPLPPDLENPPDGWINDVPNIQQFTKPKKRQVQVICPACQGLAAQWNSAADTLDSLWDRKLTLLKGMSITENAMAHRANQISRLEYQQLFSTRTDARQQQIEVIKKVNEQQQEGIEYDQRRLEEVDRSIAETDARMAAIMKQVLECEKRCQTAVATSNPPAMSAPVTQKPTFTPVASSPTGPPPIASDGPAAGPVAVAQCPKCQKLAEYLSDARDELAGARQRLEGTNAEIRAHQAKCEPILKELDDLMEKIKEVEYIVSAEGKAKFLELMRAADPCLDRSGDLEAERRVRESEVAAFIKTMTDIEEELSACNKTCASETTGTTPTESATYKANCPQCQDIVDRLNTELAELAKVRARLSQAEFNLAAAEALNASGSDAKAQLETAKKQVSYLRQLEFGIDGIVKSQQSELAACNQRCTSTDGGTTTTTTGDTPATTGTTPETAGTPPGTTDTPPPAADPGVKAACPKCEALANSIRDGRANLAKLQQRLDEIVAKYRAAERQVSAAKQQAGSVIGPSMKVFDDLRADAAFVAVQMDKQKEQLKQLEADLEACNQSCSTPTETTNWAPPTLGWTPTSTATGTTPTETGSTPTTTETTPDPGPKPAAKSACSKCDSKAKALNDIDALIDTQRKKVESAKSAQAAAEAACRQADGEHQRLLDMGKETGNFISPEFVAKVAASNKNLNDCWVRETGLEDNLRTETSQLTEYQVAWLKALTALDACNASCSTPTETTNPPGFPSDTLDPFNPVGWGPALTVDINGRVQVKFADGFDSGQVIEPTEQKDVRSWFNPLGLLTRHVRDQIDRWRGSMGPRPLLRPRDLEVIEKYSSGAQLGLPRGVHVLLTDRGGSTGKTMVMQVLNLSGRPAALRNIPFAVEPIAQEAQQRVQQAFGRLAQATPVNLDLFAYCVEFLKAPPSPNQIFRLAPKAVQDKFAPMSKVLQSAARIQKEGLLNPDSNPAAYTDAIKQWALWTVEQKLNESRFTDAFLGHTKKNVEAAGRPWPKDAEAMIRKLSPNRWRDIGQILRGAGVPVPQ